MSAPEFNGPIALSFHAKPNTNFPGKGPVFYKVALWYESSRVRLPPSLHQCKQWAQVKHLHCIQRGLRPLSPLVRDSYLCRLVCQRVQILAVENEDVPAMLNRLFKFHDTRQSEEPRGRLRGLGDTSLDVENIDNDNIGEKERGQLGKRGREEEEEMSVNAIVPVRSENNNPLSYLAAKKKKKKKKVGQETSSAYEDRTSIPVERMQMSAKRAKVGDQQFTDNSLLDQHSNGILPPPEDIDDDPCLDDYLLWYDSNSHTI